MMICLSSGRLIKNVGLEAAGVAIFLRLRARCLYDVFAPPLQAGVFEHAFQNHLAPVALGFVAAAGEGVGEGVGVVVQAVVELLQAF